MRSIAEAVGVTAMTVSLALRNDPSISAARRAQIQEKARLLGYRPDPVLSALVHYRQGRAAKRLTASLAWLNFWPDAPRLRTIPLFDAHWRGAAAAAERFGYRLEELACHRLSPARLCSILVTRGIRGVILPPQRPPVAREDFDLDWERFAAVRIGRSAPHPPVHVVTHSQAHDVLLAVRNILARGYRRVGFIGSRTLHSFSLFDAGFLKAQGGLPPEDRLPLLVLEDWPQPTPETLGVLGAWMQAHRPDAVLTTEGNMKALLGAAGYRVPADVALAATSASNGDADAGVDENPEEVGRVAVVTLAGLLQRNESGLPEFPLDILVHGRWVDGTTLPGRTVPGGAASQIG